MQKDYEVLQKVKKYSVNNNILYYLNKMSKLDCLAIFFLTGLAERLTERLTDASPTLRKRFLLNGFFRLVLILFVLNNPFFDSDRRGFASDGLIPADGKTFLLIREIENIRSIWLNPANIESQTIGNVGFVSLNRQSKSFRGKTITISGRLLQSRALSIVENDAILEKENSTDPDIIYESWILLDDERRIPVRLLTREVPFGTELTSNGFGADRKELDSIESEKEKSKAGQKDFASVAVRKIKLGNDRIQATGIYYRLTPFTDGADFFNSPTIVAPTFQILNPSTKQAVKENSFFSQYGIKFLLLLTILVFWLFLRRYFKKQSKVIKSRLILLVFSTFFFGSVFNSAEELLADQSKKQSAVQNQLVPSVENTMNPSAVEKGREYKLVADLARLKRLSRKPVRGTVFQGTIRRIDRIAVSEKDRDLLEMKEYFRLEIEEKTGTRIVFAAELPDFQINRRGVLFSNTKLTKEKSELSPRVGQPIGQGQVIGGIGLEYIGNSDKRPYDLLISKPSWYPSTSAGRLGIDVASLDAVPVFPVKALSILKQEELRLSSTQKEELATIRTKKREVLQALRFTQADIPFVWEYLSGIARASRGSLTAEICKHYGTGKSSFSAVELFNRPERYQGELVPLKGHVRRALYVPVTDPEQAKKLGRKHYYQLYLYTADSQGYPFVVSVPDLPAGMPIGSEKSYFEEVTLSAFFCKTWAYRAAGGREGDDADGQIDYDVESWLHVPFLIGGDVEWIPQKEENPLPSDFPWRFFWGSFVLLAVLYIGYVFVHNKMSASRRSE